jgi:hypothetical protein
MRKHGLRGLGLALIAALGLMALGASAAQAVELRSGGWLKSSGTFITSEGITATQTASGLLELPSKNAAILCEEATATGTIENRSADKKSEGHGSITILFLKCKVYDFTGGVKGAELTECTKTLEAPLVDKTNHHITTSVLVKTHIHNGVPYVRFSPLLGKTEFVTLTFGGTCSLPAELKIKGSIACELSPATDVTPVVATIDTLPAGGQCGKTVQTLIGEPGLSFGANPAFIQGSLSATITSGAAFGIM